MTFLWIGVLIFKNPEAWGASIMPWAAKLIPGSLVNAMLGTAVLDVLIGIFLLFNILTSLAAFIGALHILTVLITVGITDITIRDVGLLGAVIALTIEALPQNLKDRWFHNKQ